MALLGCFLLEGIDLDAYSFAGGYWLIKIAKKKGAAGAFMELRPWASLIGHYLLGRSNPNGRRASNLQNSMLLQFILCRLCII